jgi:peptide/nickel transport system permease protein
MFFLGRLLKAVPVLLLVAIATFLMILLVPGDPTSTMLDVNATPEAIERLRHQLGLDLPGHVRLLHWLGRVLQGDLGQSILLDVPVTQAIGERLPVTAALTGLSLCFSVVLGIGGGVFAALRRGRAGDRVTMLLTVLGTSVPDFWLGLSGIYLFAVVLGWLPSGGYVPFGEDPAAAIRSLILPALTLATTNIGLVARMTRSSMLEVLGQDYVRTARAKGMPGRVVVLKHALSNALMPIITVLGIVVGLLLSGAVVIETVFNLPGIGRLIVDAVLRRDYPVVQGGLLLTACTFVVINLLVDCIYGLVDPRVRIGDR